MGDFQQAHCDRQYIESKERQHALKRASLLLINDENLRMRVLMGPNFTQDPLILQLLKEVNKMKAKCQAKIPTGTN